MKKSECFKIAQEAVVRSQMIEAGVKLEVLRVLMGEEDISKLVEKNKEGKENAEI